MLEKGMAAGAIKKDDRNNRILADAKSQLERIKTMLPQQEKEAHGDQDRQSRKQSWRPPTSRLRTMPRRPRRRSARSPRENLKREDDVNMLLGISLANGKKAADAKKAFAPPRLRTAASQKELRSSGPA